MELEVFNELIIKEEIHLKSFRVSCTSDACNRQEYDLNLIGVLFLKCPTDAKTIHGRSLKPGYIHLKLIKNLINPERHQQRKTYHQQCFETIANVATDDMKNYLVFGFGVRYGSGTISLAQSQAYGMLNLTSGTFNTRVNDFLGLKSDSNNNREIAAEIFTPILQTIMRKYKLEFQVGFTLNVEHMPMKIHRRFFDAYKNLIKYNTKRVKFDSKSDFHEWCRTFYVSQKNENREFEKWFEEGKKYGDDLDYFNRFKLC